MNVEKERFPRWMTVTLAAVLLMLSTGGAFFYSIQKSNVRRQIEKEFIDIGRLKVNQITDWRKDKLNDAAILIDNSFFLRGVARFFTDHKQEESEELRRFFRSFAAHNIYADVLLTDPDGRVRLSLKGRSTLHSVYRKYLLAAFRDRKPVFTELHAEEKTAPHISVVVPIFADTGKKSPPMGALILINDATEFLYPLIKTWPTPSRSAETLLVRRDGNHVLFLNNLRYSQDAALKLSIPLTRTDVPAVMAVLGQRGIVEGKDYRGIDVLSLILPVPDSPWFMVVKEDKTEIFHRWHIRATLILGLLAAMSIGLGAVGLVTWQRNKKIHYWNLYNSETRLRTTMERHSITLKAVGDGVIATDVRGRVELMNPVAEALTGWSQNEAYGHPLEDVFRIINEQTRQKAEDPVSKVLRDGMVVGLANHTLLIAQNGIERPIADSAAPITDTGGEIVGVVLVFRDQTEERRAQRLMQVRLNLLEFAATNSLEDLMKKALDEIGTLAQSPIGFYHFVENDQKTVSFQQWSSRTLNECRVKGNAMHYVIDHAGVWTDCVFQRRPVVHNDYANLPHRGGLPEGHIPIVRDVVVPVLNDGKVVAIVGVGNKSDEYTEKDVETVSYLADVTWRILDGKRTDEMLLDSEERYRDLFDNAPIGIFSTTSRGKVLSVNISMARMLGFSSPKEAMEHYTDIQKQLYVHPEQRAQFLQELMKKGRVENFDYEAHTKDGKTAWLRMNARIARHEDDGVCIIEGFVSDITSQRTVEAQLLQAQKMESVGRLAGGVAHDYNNMLSVILGYAELAMEKVPTEHILYDDLEEIHKAALRSTEVTRQLLAFARKQTISPKIIDINERIEGTLKMLIRLIGEDIDLEWMPHKNLWPVRMDPSQLNQILANLCVNARDAIAGVGKITIETNNVTFDSSYCKDHVDFVPGEFVLFAVSDNGCGMDKATLDKLFEPFFTTKQVGVGTGLGLATVYGIVKQNDGFINVYSEPDQGTIFKVYLPRHGDTVSDIRQNATETTPLGHDETVLLVEDEAAILNMTNAMLKRLGYSVLTASSPTEAIHVAEHCRKKISLLITDVVMPKINGRELAEQVRSFFPGIKILFMSGYTSNVIAHHGVLEEGVAFMQKPFSLHQLASRVRETMDRT